MPERIVITGMGAITPVGHSVEQTWDNLVEGVSGVAPITRFDTSDLLVKIACEVKDFHPEEHMERAEARRRDRYQHFATVATREAINQAGLLDGSLDPHRIGVILSSSVGGMESITENIRVMINQGSRRVSPFVIPMFMPNGAAGMIEYRLWLPRTEFFGHFGVRFRVRCNWCRMVYVESGRDRCSRRRGN